MSQRFEWTVCVILILALAPGLAACGGKMERDHVKADPVLVDGREMLQAFAEDEYMAEEKYLQETLRVQGMVTSITNDLFGRPLVVLDGTATQGVVCHFASDPHGAKSLRVGVRAVLEGWAESYDGTVNLERCRVIEAY